MNEHEVYDEVYAYSMMLGDAAFIAQHVVDAFAAQTADQNTKHISLTFALVGLYLHVERHFTGRQVQQAHQRLAKRKRTWPQFVLPPNRGSMTATDVLARPTGLERDQAIHAWAATVWQAFHQSANAVEELLSGYPELFYDRARLG